MRGSRPTRHVHGARLGGTHGTMSIVSKLVLPEAMRMHDAGKFGLDPEVENTAHKDEYKQYNRLQSLLFCQRLCKLLRQHVHVSTLCTGASTADV
jgi:hypothetical protein